jgi:XTP/dITP diphosphohydrolase
VTGAATASGPPGAPGAATAPGPPDAAPTESGALGELVAVMDRLRSPGGCPWDAEQTHQSLVRYCLEEAYEVAEAIETGDRDAMREELGDLLLQVVFHARIAQEDPTDPFDLEDVARGVSAKLIRRHPHVFADVVVDSAEQVHTNWELIKKAEKGRDSVTDGIPRAQGALARATSLLGRARRAGVAIDLAALADEVADPRAARLLALVAEAEAAGVDAEGLLRSSLDRVEEHIRESERETPRAWPEDLGPPTATRRNHNLGPGCSI